MIGLVLAGGQSTRFGRDKALFTLPGQKNSNVQVAVSHLLPFCQEVLVCVNQLNHHAIMEQLRTYPRTRILLDQPPFAQHGPLSAIYAASKEIPGLTRFLMVAVDYPYLSRESVKRLANHPNSVAVAGKITHYTVANLATNNEQVTAWLQANNWRLGDFVLNCCHCQPLYFDNEREFINLNYFKGANDEDKRKYDRTGLSKVDCTRPE